MAFGSCRTSVPHDAEGNDAARCRRPARLRLPPEPAPTPARRTGRTWCVFLGDQVYADETIRGDAEFIASRRSLDEPPGEELKDYEEYAHLYWLAWTDPLNRWLLSTLPSAMIFDDHDIRDDWNTSQRLAPRDGRRRRGGTTASSAAWRRTGSTSTSATSSPERAGAEDEMWQRIAGHARPRAEDELDLTEVLDDLRRPRRRAPGDLPLELRPRPRRVPAGRRRLAGRAGARARTAARSSTTTRWPGSTSSCSGDVDHLFIGTSLPFLMAPGHPRPRGDQRGDGRGRLGPAGGPARREDAPGRSTSSTGRPSRRASPQVLDMVVEVAERQARARARHHHVPVRRRAQLLRHRDRPRRSSRRQQPRSCRRSAPRSATRCPRQVRIAQAMLGKGLARPLQFLVRPHRQGAQRAIPVAGDRGARGSTTTWRPSRSAVAAW